MAISFRASALRHSVEYDSGSVTSCHASVTTFGTLTGTTIRASLTQAAAATFTTISGGGDRNLTATHSAQIHMAPGEAQTFTTGVIAAMSFTAIGFETDPNMVDLDADPTRITVPASGTYLVSASGSFHFGAAGDREYLIRATSPGGSIRTISRVVEPAPRAGYIGRDCTFAVVHASSATYFQQFMKHTQGSDLRSANDTAQLMTVAYFSPLC